MVRREDALPGRDRPTPVASRHAVLDAPLDGPFPGLETALFGMGCFWGAKKKLFWQADGVRSTSVGYAGGFTPNPTYEEVCSGLTGHAEVVRVVFDPRQTSYAALLKLFWEGHDPTQGMRQGNDRGTPYRSAIYAATDGPRRDRRGEPRPVPGAVDRGGLLARSQPRSPALRRSTSPEDSHQQYLAKNPFGYCGLGGTGVTCPAGITTAG